MPKSRASKPAKLLVDLAEEHARVLFVGHGVYNRLLAKELKSLGWSGPKNSGSKYWSLRWHKKKDAGGQVLFFAFSITKKITIRVESSVIQCSQH